ncbi:RING finger and WD repeat domain-containing protein 3 [Podila humilis]|nr:RING finger and WD repeat domain-containing protein 3 [Podila humilis]
MDDFDEFDFGDFPEDQDLQALDNIEQPLQGPLIQSQNDPPPPQQTLEAPPPQGHEEDQDPDFQSQSNVVIRVRAGTGVASVPEPRPKNVVTEIPISRNSCISKWIATQLLRGPAKCPECNRPAKKNDIRRLWSKAVVTLDTAEKESAVSRLKQEQEARMRSETELANSKRAYQMLKIEMANLQKKHDRQRSLKLRYKTQAKRLKMGRPEDDIKKTFTYSLFRTIPIPGVYQPTKTSQYLSYRANEEMLICSRQIQDTYGIAKVSMRDFSNNLMDIIPIHSKPIRDVQCYNADPFANESLVLTASMDQHLKITSAKSQQVVLGPISKFSDPELLGMTPIHSLTHIGPTHGRQREGLLCGNLQGAFVYNFEPKSMPLSSSSWSSSQGGVSNNNNNNSSGIPNSQDSMLSFQGSAIEKQVPLHIPGASCYSVSMDLISREWLASFKFLGKNFTEHVRGTLEQQQPQQQDQDDEGDGGGGGEGGDLYLKSFQKVTGGPPVPSLARTSVFSRLDGSVHFAVGSESVVNVWCDRGDDKTISSGSMSSLSFPSSQEMSAGSKSSMLTLRTNTSTVLGKDAVKDVKSVVVDQDEFLVSLTDRSLQIFRWSELRKFSDLYGGDEDDDDDDDDEDEDVYEDGGYGREGIREGSLSLMYDNSGAYDPAGVGPSGTNSRPSSQQTEQSTEGGGSQQHAVVP